MRSITSDPDGPSAPRSEGGDVLPHVLFDTNAIRAVGSLPIEEWDGLLARWRLHRLRTSWVPHVLGEIMGTNLVRKTGLSHRGLWDCQRSVRRFNVLAKGVIADPSEVVVARSIYELAGEPFPESPDAPAWKEGIDLFGRLRGPEDIESEQDGENLVVTMRGRKQPGERGSIVIPRDFRKRAREKVKWLAADIPKRKSVTMEDLAADARAEMDKWWPAAVAGLNIPIEIVERARRSDGDVMGSAFVFTSICGFVYHHFRATGAKSRIKENDAPDLALTTYFPQSRAFITDDGDLRRLVGTVINTEGGVFKFEEFMEVIAQDPA